MRVRLSLFAIAIALAGCSGVGAITGAQAPDVWFNPVSDPERRVDLRDWRGNVVLLDFWATWCGPCRQTMPKVQLLHTEFAEKGLVVAAISEEALNTVARFLEDTPYDYPMYVDRSGDAFEAFQVKAIPKAFVIGKDGVIRWSGHPGDHSELRKAIVEALER